MKTDETPTDEGKRRYPNDENDAPVGWYYDPGFGPVHACTCSESCPDPCCGTGLHGNCKCIACFSAYCDATFND